MAYLQPFPRDFTHGKCQVNKMLSCIQKNVIFASTGLLYRGEILVSHDKEKADGFLDLKAQFFVSKNVLLATLTV